MKKDLDKIFNRYKDEYADWEYVDESFDIYDLVYDFDETIFYSSTNPLTRFVKSITHYMDKTGLPYKFVLSGFYAKEDVCYVAVYALSWYDKDIELETYTFETNY